jgi:hypothetical protein
MSFPLTTGAMLATYTLAMLSTNQFQGVLTGMFVSTYTWPMVEYLSHQKSHTSQPNEACSEKSVVHQIVFQNMMTTAHGIVAVMLVTIASLGTAIGYIGTTLFINVCSNTVYILGDIDEFYCPSLSWAARNSTAWNWEHQKKQWSNFGISTPYYDLLAGTANKKMLARYNHGWRKWLLPFPWIVFAFTAPDPSATIDKTSEDERERRSAEARRRQTASTK